MRSHLIRVLVIVLSLVILALEITLILAKERNAVDRMRRKRRSLIAILPVLR